MVITAPAVQLVGRQRERGVIDRMLEAARDGHGGALAVYGEPGVLAEPRPMEHRLS